MGIVGIKYGYQDMTRHITDTVGWPIESNVAAAKDAEIKEGDTVIVFGKVFSYDSGF